MATGHLESFCSQAKGKSFINQFTQNKYSSCHFLEATLRPLWMCQCWSVSVDLLSWPPALTQVTPPSFENPLSEVTQPTAGHSATLPVPLDSIHMQIALLNPLFDLHISIYIFAKAVGANLQSDSWIWLERGLSIFAMFSVLMLSSGLLNSLSAQCHAFLRVSCGPCQNHPF